MSSGFINNLTKNKMNQKGFAQVALIVVLIVLGVGGYFALSKKEKSEPVAPETTEVDTSNWETYQNPIHNYSFLYPQVDYEIDDSDPSGEGYAPNGEFGNLVYKEDTGLIFSVEVLSTPEFSTVGTETEILKKGFANGGIEEVARLSREVNLQLEENFSNKEVGELKMFSYKNGIGYGFTMTGVFNFCFNNEIKCESGEVLTFVPPYDKFHINGPWAIVYVTNGEKIYLIKFPVNSIAPQIFSTLEF